MDARLAAIVGAAATLVACGEPLPAPERPIVVPTGSSAPSPASASPPIPAPPSLRAIVEVIPTEHAAAAVPLLCHDGTGWMSDRDACVERLRQGLRIVGRDGTWRAAGTATAIADRDYRGATLPPDAPAGLAFVGVDAAPPSRCRSIEIEPPALDALWPDLTAEVPHREAFARASAEEVRHHAFAGDFDGDGTDDVLHSITIETAEGRIDLVLLRRGPTIQRLGLEWSVDDAFGGAPDRRLVDVRHLWCFELDGEPGLEIVAAMRGETERDHIGATFRGSTLLPVGHAVFFGD